RPATLHWAFPLQPNLVADRTEGHLSVQAVRPRSIAKSIKNLLTELDAETIVPWSGGDNPMARKPGDKNFTPQVRRIIAEKDAKIATLEGKVAVYRIKRDEWKAVAQRLQRRG